MRVRKVYPEVRERRFRTELVFVGEKPEGIRTGQTCHISLELGLSTEAVMIPRGAFYGDTGGRWIYVLSSDGKRAVRRDITIGRQNADHYEILSGLQAGEEVIISHYQDFGTATELIFK